MAKYQKYAEYKDSGVEWLGAIPGHWGVTQLKRLGKFITGMTPSTAVEAYYSDEITEYGWIRPEDILEESEKVEPTKFLTKLGWETQRTIPAQSTLICCIGTIGKLGFLGKRAVTNQQITALVPDVRGFSKYYYYLLTASRNQLEHLATGNVVKILNSERLGSLWLPLLSSQNEARQIVHFLDYETAKIDHLIEKQQQLIELLKEKRQAVISHAVTKGLDPNVPMKDSGVEWLGEVPEHWKIIKGGYIGTLFGSESIQEDDVTDQGSLPFIKVSSLSAETFKLSNIDWFVSERRAKFCKAEKNYIVFPKRGAAIFTNKVNVIEVDSVIDPNLMGWKIGKQGITEYFALLLKTRGLDDIADVSTVPQINNKHIAPEKFPLPPLSEQCEIVKFVGMELTKFDEMILKAESAIQLMQERRTALISAAVTGKIDVRNWQAPTLAGAQTELSA